MAQKGQWIAVGGILGALAFALGAALLLTPEMGRVIPGADAPPLRAVDAATGDSVTIDEFGGDVVLLNIWATWCGPCEAEMPSMQRLYEQLGHDGLRILAVSVDLFEGREGVMAWAAERDLTFPILHDKTGRIQQTYQTTGVPESFVIDKHGVIVKKVIGSLEWDEPAQLALFRRLLADE
jgi:thiol-disulfide isomerase/thioredoxin